MTADSKHRVSPWLWVPSLYMAEGIPFFIVTVLSIALYTQLGVSNARLSLFTSLITFPWIIKPLWSPFVDVLRTNRWWVILMQVLMCLTVGALALLAPRGQFSLGLILFTITAFCSATHDIAADGFYMQALSAPQQAIFVGIRSTFYKIAAIFCQSVLLVLVGYLERSSSVAHAWTIILLLCSALLALLSLWHIFSLPRVEEGVQASSLNGIWEGVLQSFATFFRKPQIALALTFMLLYRLPEALLLKLCIPFLSAPVAQGGLALNMQTIGTIYGGIGVGLMLLGGILGGWAISRWGLKRCMVWMCLMLTLPCIVYCYLAAVLPTNLWLIGTCIGFEQFGYGLGYTACMMYMIHFAQGAYKTSHFSVCTAFMYLGLMLPGLIAGYIQEAVGYLAFFWIVMATCLPSILITLRVQKSLNF